MKGRVLTLTLDIARLRPLAQAMSKVKTRPLWYILDGRHPLTGDQSHAVLYTVKTRGPGCKSCAIETTITTTRTKTAWFLNFGILFGM
jgi:hypothetical protein